MKEMQNQKSGGFFTHVETSDFDFAFNYRGGNSVSCVLPYQEALPALSLWELILDRPFHLKIHEGNQATTLVAKRGFSSKLRCVQRTHKVNLACIAEQLESDHISIEYVKTDMQSADIFTKALPPNKWDHAIRLLGICVDLPEKLEDVRESRSAKAGA